MPGLTSTRRIPPGAGIEYVLLAEPARHEGGLDEELENRFRRCGNENLAFNIDYSVHRCLGLRSFPSASRFNRDNPLSQNDASSACSLVMAG